MEYHYTAREAIERLGLPRSTFYYLIRSGQIHKIDVPLRKQSLYVKEEIDRLAAEREQIFSRRVIRRRRLSFSVPSASDLNEMSELSRQWPKNGRMTWHPSTEEWQHYNPEIMHVLKDTHSGAVFGGIMMSPVKADALQRLIGHPSMQWRPRMSDVLPFEASDQAPIDVCVFDVVVRPSVSRSPLGALLLRGTLRFLESLLDRGVVVHRVFTAGVSSDGDRLAHKLGFTQLPLPPGGDPRVQRYELNLLEAYPKSKLIAAYQRSYHNQRRRVRRYQQAAIGTHTT